MPRTTASRRSVVLLLLLAACTELSVEAVDVARVVVAPEDALLRIGETLRLSAEAQDGEGNVLVDRPIAWTVSDETVVQIDPDGSITAVGPGTATIRATAGGRTGEAQIEVYAGTVSSVQITPRLPVVLVSGTLQLSVQVLDTQGEPIDEPVQWSTSDASVLTVAAGLLTGMKQGAAWVRAVAGGVTDSTLATVVRLPPGTVNVSPGSATALQNDTLRFQAAVLGDNGLPVTDAVVTWSTADERIATVDANGLVTARDSGRVDVVASAEGRSGSATLLVQLRPVSAVIVTPDVVGLSPGGSIQLNARAEDAQGRPLPGRRVAWSSSNAQVASVDNAGRVTAHSSGSAQITATIDGVSGEAHIAVTPAPVASVDVTPAASKLAIGDTVRLTATPRDGNGAPLGGRAVSWSSSDPALATVDNAGLVRAFAAGNVTITATVGGVPGTATVEIATPVARIDVTPPNAQVAPGGTVQLTTTARDASGAAIPGVAIAWSTSASGVATVDNAGVVRGVAAGTATVTATGGGATGTAKVDVVVPVASVDVTPGTAQISTGGTVKLTATPRASNGAALTGRPVAWSTTDPTIATVDGTGLVTGVGAGSATIRATSEGQTGTATVEVFPPVTRVVVAPNNPVATVGDTVQLTATVFTQGNNPIPNYPAAWITWGSSNDTLATVDGNGLVTIRSNGLIVGSVVITATAGGASGSTRITILP